MRIGEQKNIIDRVVSKENQIFIDHSPEYVGQAQNILSPAFFLSCLEIAKNFFETRKAYYESETARLDYKASIKKDEKEDEEMFEAYRERRKKIELEASVKKVVDEIGVGKSGKTHDELKTQLIKATTELVKELEKGTEFHLSLNPPSYANRERQSFVIDYSKVREITNPKEVILVISQNSEDNIEESQID
jgi:hypothetical protein